MTDVLDNVTPEVADAALAAIEDSEEEQEETALATVEGEVIVQQTPLERLVANEKTIDKGLKQYEKKSTEIAATKEEVGAALYTIYNDKLWKARKLPNGKPAFKNFSEYLASKGWEKTASRAFQLMAEHRKALKANNEEVIESKRGPKPNNPGRSAQTFANALIDLRSRFTERAEQMTGDSEAETEFVEIVERFLEATAEFVSEFETLADKERGAEVA